MLKCIVSATVFTPGFHPYYCKNWDIRTCSSGVVLCSMIVSYQLSSEYKRNHYCTAFVCSCRVDNLLPVNGSCMLSTCEPSRGVCVFSFVRMDKNCYQLNIINPRNNYSHSKAHHSADGWHCYWSLTNSILRSFDVCTLDVLRVSEKSIWDCFSIAVV